MVCGRTKLSPKISDKFGGVWKEKPFAKKSIWKYFGVVWKNKTLAKTFSCTIVVVFALAKHYVVSKFSGAFEDKTLAKNRKDKTLANV